MISIFTAFLLLFIYGLSQYLIAHWGGSHTKAAEEVRHSATTYTFSLAVFCTSWTYYGNVGQASGQGLSHISLYLGSSLAFILLTPLLKKMVRIKNVFHSTSIADFISTRYNNSQLLAAIITLLCLVGITPYISIQLKSIITTFNLLVNNNTPRDSFFISQLDIIIVLLMALFTIVFGVRKLDPTERHPGMMVAIAAESIFKLLALTGAGFFICFILFDGFADIINTVNLRIQYDDRFEVFSHPPAISSWFTSMLLGIVGVIALPRQFHVGIVECSNEKMLDRARWLFPFYLFVINLLVLPIAMAGLILLPQGSSADLMLLQIPILQNQTSIAAMVFLGGFAASTGMIMVSAMTLSTMATNHLVLPLIESIPRVQFLRRYLLYTRWLIVVTILFLGLFYYRAIGDSEIITRIGSISFVAIAQLLPALIGGLAWKKGNIYGALAGLIGGSIIWYFTLMLPSVIRSGWLQIDLLTEGLFGIPWLKPEQLFGLQLSSAVDHSLFWSLLVNICLYILVSESVKLTDQEQINHTEKFLRITRGRKSSLLSSKNLVANICLTGKFELLMHLFSRYLPEHRAQEKLTLCYQQCQLNQNDNVDILQLSQLRTKVTSILAGIIGMAAANRAVKSIELLNEQEQNLLSSCYSDLLAKSQMSPEELLEKVDFYQEKQQLLQNHAEQQDKAITQLKWEKAQTIHAKRALNELNEELEERVIKRTKQLTTANDELIIAMSELKSTQNKLVEADKMASLGALVAGVAHEINTPVGIVLTAISSLEEKLITITELYHQQNLTKKNMEHFFNNLAEIIDISLRNIKRATNLVDSFKQVAVDQTSEEHRMFNVYDYLQSILLSLKPKLKRTNHKITIDCDQTLTIESYPGALSQVMSNLIINSLIHGFEDIECGHINITVKLNDNILHLDYSDDGKGLSEQGIANIFEPFYTTQRGTGGSGLGAHIVYNIVTQRLQGEISVDNQLKQGLCFNIRFPVIS